MSRRPALLLPGQADSQGSSDEVALTSPGACGTGSSPNASPTLLLRQPAPHAAQPSAPSPGLQRVTSEDGTGGLFFGSLGAPPPQPPQLAAEGASPVAGLAAIHEEAAGTSLADWAAAWAEDPDPAWTAAHGAAAFVRPIGDGSWVE